MPTTSQDFVSRILNSGLDGPSKMLVFRCIIVSSIVFSFFSFVLVCLFLIAFDSVFQGIENKSGFLSLPLAVEIILARWFAPGLCYQCVRRAKVDRTYCKQTWSIFFSNFTLFSVQPCEHKPVSLRS